MKILSILFWLFIVTGFIQISAQTNSLNPYSFQFSQHQTNDTQVTPKSESTAVLLSLGSTITPVFLGALLLTNEVNGIGGIFMVSGLIAGPSLGKYYAEDNASALKGIFIRTGSLVIMTSGAYLLLSNSCIFGPCSGSDPGTELTGSILYLSGILGYAISAIYDIFNSRLSVRKFNQRNMSKVTLSPVLIPQHNGIGIGLNVSF